MVRSANATLDRNSADGNRRTGIRVDGSTGLAITNNDADDNGIRIQKSPPIGTTADLTAAGNTATGNGLLDLRVQ